MSEQNKDAIAVADNNAMPTPPAADETITTLNNAMPKGPAVEETIKPLNNAMPAGTAPGDDK